MTKKNNLSSNFLHGSNKIYILFKKELLAYFNSPIAYIFIAVFLIISNWMFLNYFFVSGQAEMRSYFSFLPWIFLFLAPAMTMRLWAEEKKSGTAELLLTLPVTDWQIVLGKFFGSLVFLFISLLLSITLPISISFLGDMDMGVVFASYLGSLFLGGSYLALGLFISSLTRNQIVAFVLGVVFCFIGFILGADFVLKKAPQFLLPIMKFFGIGSHFYNIAKGVVDTKDIIYYLSFIFLFLWLNVRVIERRQWR